MTFLTFEDRDSDSLFVEKVWRCRSDGSGTLLSIAQSHWELVITQLEGRTIVTLHGPETRARTLPCPANGEWFSIRFAAGTFMPQLPTATLVNGQDVHLPASWRRSFWFHGSRWEYPTFENAETFVARLAGAGIIARDSAVIATLEGDTQALSKRSSQRHFMRAAGMTYGTLRQIERARYATNLLRSGASVMDTVHRAGFFDQAHLTRSLRSLIGLTPAKVASSEQQLSFLYKTQLAARL